MKKTKLWLWILLSLLLFTMAPARAYAAESGDEDVTLAPYFFIENADPSLDSFPLKATDVVTNIDGVIAETYVTQTYTNAGTRPINARYVFPASAKVSVHGMKMILKDKVVTAQIREKEEAKEEFEQAKSEGKSASLLEQQRANVFTMSLANIMPGDVVRIELHYTELITPTEGTYRFVFPTVVGPRYCSPALDENGETNEWVDTPYLEEGQTPDASYNISVSLAAGVPITALSCKSHDIKVAQETESTVKVTLSNPQEYSGNRDFILDYQLTGQDVSCGLMLSEGEDENFFLLMMQPPERFDPEDIVPREYIFVLDISGSMYGYPLDTAKELIRDLVASLKETDKFNLVLFADDVIPLSGKSLPATSANISRAVNLIDNADGGGGTKLLNALKYATALPADDSFSRSVVVITDGYIWNEKEIYEHIRQNVTSASFFSFGIGTSVNRYLVEGIANVGTGEAFIVTDAEDAADTASRFRTYIQSPLLTDIQLGFEGFDAYDIEPAAQPTLFARTPIVLFGKWRGEPSGTIRLTGKSASRDYVQEISVADVTPLPDDNALPYLWARKRVEQLSDYSLCEEDEVKQEITQLGLTYSIMTPYTSFIAVVDTVRNQDLTSTDVKQPSPLPSGVSNFAVSSGYTIGSEPDEILLFCMLALTLALGACFRRRRYAKQAI